MNDDTLLDKAARAARDAARRDPLHEDWDRFSDGSISEEERQALLERSDDAKLAERAAQAFRPFDDADKADFVAAALAARTTTRLSSEADDEDDEFADDKDEDAPPAASESAAGGNVVPLRPRAPRAAWAFGLAASAVLAVGFVISSGVFGPDGDGALPGYGYDLRGTAEVRSAASRSVRADQTFELILTPDTALSSPAQVRLFVAEGDTLRPLDALTLDVAASGAARITASAASLPVGDSLLVAVVSRGEWPERLAAGERSDDWQAIRIPLTVLPATGDR